MKLAILSQFLRDLDATWFGALYETHFSINEQMNKWEYSGIMKRWIEAGNLGNYW